MAAWAPTLAVRPRFAFGVTIAASTGVANVAIATAFLTRDASKRLGCAELGVGEIKSHPFFAPIDWDKLLAQEMPCPFEPDLEYERPAPPRRPSPG